MPRAKTKKKPVKLPTKKTARRKKEPAMPESITLVFDEVPLKDGSKDYAIRIQESAWAIFTKLIEAGAKTFKSTLTLAKKNQEFTQEYVSLKSMKPTCFGSAKTGEVKKGCKGVSNLKNIYRNGEFIGCLGFCDTCSKEYQKQDIDKDIKFSKR